MVVAGTPCVSTTSPDVAMSADGTALTILIRAHRPVPLLAKMTAQCAPLAAPVGNEPFAGVMNPVGDWTWMGPPGGIILTGGGPGCGRIGTGHTTWVDALPREM